MKKEMLKTISRSSEVEEVGSITQTVVRYIAQSKFSDFPKEVIEYAKLCIQDPIACALGAAATEPGQVIIKSMKDMGGKPECTVIGDGAKIHLLNAAYVNARLANFFDWDDTYDFLGHPGCTIVGSALAAAEAVGASGKDLITAVILAYEVATRIGDAITHSGWKPGLIGTQSWKIFGAVVPVAKLLGLSEIQMVNALGLAGHSCIGFPIKAGAGRYRLKGRNAWTKHPTDHRSLYALLGTLAAIQAKDGFESDLDALDSTVFWVQSGAEYCDYPWITRWLGKQYNILNNGFKPTPNCRMVHASLTGVKELLDDWPLKPEQIESINIRSFSLAGGMMNKHPRTIVDTERNLPYAIAMIVKGERPGLNWYTTENLEDPLVMSIEQKVHFAEDPQATEILATEGRWTATVEIVAKNGDRKAKHVPYAWGEAQNPMTRAEHRHKFEACASGILDERRTAEIMAVLRDLENIEKITVLTGLLYPES